MSPVGRKTVLTLIDCCRILDIDVVASFFISADNVADIEIFRFVLFRTLVGLTVFLTFAFSALCGLCRCSTAKVEDSVPLNC